MIFHENKLIFLHPGKTGGTSIEHFFVRKYLNKAFSELNPLIPDYYIMYGYCKKSRLYLHHADIRYYNKENLDIPIEYTKILSVRRPYERILSAYFYNGHDKKLNFEDFITQKLEKLYRLNSEYSRNHFSPLIHYYNPNFHVIKLESIEIDCKKLDIKLSTHKHAKTIASQRYKNYLDAYSSKTKDIVYSLYKEDFKTFAYDK